MIGASARKKCVELLKKTWVLLLKMWSADHHLASSGSLLEVLNLRPQITPQIPWIRIYILLHRQVIRMHIIVWEAPDLIHLMY